MRRVAVLGAALIALFAAACGSSSSSSSNGGSSPAPATSGAPTAGAGLTSPTTPPGTKQTGGTVYYTEGPSAPPNYIFPMTAAQVCGTNNISQLQTMLFRPLYWYGNDYTPTMDPDYSLAEQPTFSNGDKTVTVKLKPWKWSDGEAVTSRQIAFWMNLYKADPSKNYCGYVPGYFPDNVTAVQTPDAQTVVFKLDKAYNPEWFTYNELSQIYPLPLAWDRTSMSQPAPKSDNGHLPDSTKAGAESVYKFLDTRVQVAGHVGLLAAVERRRRTVQAQELHQQRAGHAGPEPGLLRVAQADDLEPGRAAVHQRHGDLQRDPLGRAVRASRSATCPRSTRRRSSRCRAEGFDYNRAASYSINYFPFNLNNPKVGPIFRQLYFRQAFQHLIDQQGWINAFLHNTAIPTYGPIPVSPPSPLLSVDARATRSRSRPARPPQLLTSHGWKVVSGGSTTCQHPGTAANECGAGITAGEGISFNLDYQSGVTTLASEMNDLAAQAKRVGIDIQLTSHPFDTVISTAVACKPTDSDCGWTAENWGAGWIYAPDFLPTGESLFAPGRRGQLRQLQRSAGHRGDREDDHRIGLAGEAGAGRLREVHAGPRAGRVRSHVDRVLPG